MTPDCEERPPRSPSSDIDGLSPVLRLERMDSTGLAQEKKEHPPKQAQKNEKKKGHKPIGPKRKRIGLLGDAHEQTQTRQHSFISSSDPKRTQDWSRGFAISPELIDTDQLSTVCQNPH